MRRRLKTALCGAVLLAAACARAVPPVVPSSGVAPTAAGQAAGGTLPVGDHHAHIFTRAAISRVFAAPLPAVELPAELDRLLRERARGWNDDAALAPLYTENSLAVSSRNPRWVRGREAVANFVAQLFGRPHRILPIAWQVDGSTGFIAGYFTREVETGLRYFGHAHLSLSRGADGVWRIAAESLTFPGPRVPDPVAAEQLIAEMDAGGMRRAAVLSTAYWFASASADAPAENEYASVRAENDYVAEQVARFPDRLVGFCSFNPLRDYALQELARCAGIPQVKGVKLHFGDSGVNVLDSLHVERMREVFHAANEHRLAIVVHLMGPDPSYGRQHSQIFLDRIVPAAPDIPIQIAHMAGSGPYYNSDEAFAVFSEAAAAGDPRMRNLWTDVATVVTLDAPAEMLALVARRMREFGLDRVLYGSDTPASPEFTGHQGWVYFRRLPLTDEELRTIADNLAPYLR